MIYCDFVLRDKRERKKAKKDMSALFVCSHFQPCEPMHFPQQGNSRLQHQGSFFMLMRMELCCAIIPASTEVRDPQSSVPEWATCIRILSGPCLAIHRLPTADHLNQNLWGGIDPRNQGTRLPEDHEY